MFVELPSLREVDKLVPIKIQALSLSSSATHCSDLYMENSTLSASTMTLMLLAI